MEIPALTDDASSLCTIHSDDANHQADNLINWQQEYDQLSPGRFFGVINEINFPHIHLFREDSNRELHQHCRVEEGGLWLGFSADNKSCRINNQQTRSDQFLCRPGSRDFELLTPDDFSIFGLVLHKSFFTQLEALGEEPSIYPATDGLWLENIPPGKLHSFRQYLTLLLQPEGHRWSAATQALILHDAVVDLLSQAHYTPATQVCSQQRQRIMQRVNDYLTHTRLKSPITITELCRAVNVSRRTLQYTFAQCCGMSPKRYIQISRLNQVRRALLSADSSLTIGEVALEYGFFHMGQFGHDYKCLFAETPQETRLRGGGR